mmetsp:Transcript_29161/g.59676  ORF Transcript_29161/g.59676 Transcript_29161/m.59676 type:complete len:424 (-) Transcript_29161:204-1475(-)
MTSWAASAFAQLVACIFSVAYAETSCSSPVIAGTLQVLVDGLPKSVYVVDSSESGTISVKGNAITLPHGPRVYLAETCAPAMSSDMFWFPDFTKYSLSFTVDVSAVGCGCNGAVYLVNMPSATITSCGDYYCDANYVCGEGCNEFDIMEANNHAAQVTPHKCGADGTSDCDGGGCATKLVGFGVSGVAIDSSKPFRVELAVGSVGAVNADDDEASSAVATSTTYSQEGAVTVVRHTDKNCGASYMEGMQPTWQNMVVTASNWGDSGGGMSWLDGDAGCSDSTSCNKGAFTFSDVRLCSLEGGNPGCSSVYDSATENDDGDECSGDAWYGWWWCKGVYWLEQSHPWWQWVLAGSIGFLVLALMCFVLRVCLCCVACARCFKRACSCCPCGSEEGKEEVAPKPYRRTRQVRRARGGGELKSPLLS